MASDQLLVDVHGPVLRVTINRPDKRNALSRDVLAQLAEAFAGQVENPELRAAVLRGAGERSFAAGGDLNDLSSIRTLAEAEDMATEAKRALNAVRDFPLPVVAALNGDALGGGAELAVASDFIVAGVGKRIGFVQGRLNITTAWGGGIDLFKRVGTRHALRLLTRSEMVEAGEAVAIGLIDCMAQEDEDIDAAVDRFLEPIVRQAPQVLRAFKALARAADGGADRSALEEIETRRFAEAWIHDDHWAAAEKLLAPRRQG